MLKMLSLQLGTMLCSICISCFINRTSDDLFGYIFVTIPRNGASSLVVTVAFLFAE